MTEIKVNTLIKVNVFDCVFYLIKNCTHIKFMKELTAVVFSRCDKKRLIKTYIKKCIKF